MSAFSAHAQDPKPWTARPLMLSWILVSAALQGCVHHDVSFQDAGYTIDTAVHKTGIVAVIDQATLDNKVPITSVMTGAAHSWEAQPGDMLKQVADIELVQMFQNYEFATRSPSPQPRKDYLTLALSIPSYTFEDFHASITVRAIATDAEQNPLFDKTYSEEGESQGAKMFFAGAFGMKSAIRQSSLDAYKKIFAVIRRDLFGVLAATPQG